MHCSYGFFLFNVPQRYENKVNKKSVLLTLFVIFKSFYFLDIMSNYNIMDGSNDTNTFSKILKRYIHIFGVEQQVIAAGANIASSTLSKILSGEIKKTHKKNIIKIIRFLGHQDQYFMGADPEWDSNKFHSYFRPNPNNDAENAVMESPATYEHNSVMNMLASINIKLNRILDRLDRIEQLEKK